ncbi:FAD/NAD(P)-binding domain-containing protein [Thozetella sp. PMI_491]|nr:FAD/NAD(P)-binding domain-containing protein [Thozetella sp. PMI_491]
MGETQQLQLAIVGAGLAGLAAAIALKSHPGIDIQIYERASELKEIGASIALSPNGMRTLERLGVLNALDDSIAFRNKSGAPMIHRHWRTDEILSNEAHRGEVDYRHRTTRYYRPHLQESLLAHVEPSRIQLSKRFQSVLFDKQSKSLVLKFIDESTVNADILIGADGIPSAIRTYFLPESQTSWTGGVSFRSVFPISHVAHIPDLPDEANLFWGLDRTLFVSRLGGELFTVVDTHQSIPGDKNTPYKDAKWDSESDMDVLRSSYKDWSPLIRAIINATPNTRVYPNTAAYGIDSWVLGNGRATLVGDAADAHGGAFAAGGGLALDDASVFAAAMLHVFPVGAERLPAEAELAQALRLYEATRKAHIDQILKIVHGMHKKNLVRHDTVETDDKFRARIKNIGDLSWLY